MSRPKGAKNGSCIRINCLFCKQDFITHHTTQKYCSLKCRSYHKSDLFCIFKNCLICNKNFKLTKHKKNKTCSSECRSIYQSKICTGRKFPHTLEWNKNIGDSQRGEKSHLWKGGATLKNKLLRRSVEFKEWRLKVFERDDYTCQDCGVRGFELHPDHIKPFALFPEFRFDINNGRTLCASCHRKTPTWGVNTKYLKREDFV